MHTSTNPPPLRLSLPRVCEILDLSREGLRKLQRRDPSFPRPIKSGTTRQASVYFDYAELIAWHENQKGASA